MWHHSFTSGQAADRGDSDGDVNDMQVERMSFDVSEHSGIDGLESELVNGGLS